MWSKRHFLASILVGLSVARTAAGENSPSPPRIASLEAKLTQILAGGTGLTADEVAKRAAATSPDVQEKRSDLIAAQRRSDQSRDQFYPKLVGTARYTRASEIPTVTLGPPDTGIPMSGDTSVPMGAMGNQIVSIVDNYVAEARLTVPISDYVLKLSAALGAASRSRRAAALNEKATRLAVAANARIAYYQWIRAQGNLLVAEQALAQASVHLEDANRAFEAGSAPKADVLRATSSQKNDELLVARAANQRGLAEEQLRVLMHDPPDTTYAVGENVLLPLPPFAAASAAVLQAEALENRLEVRALDESEYSLRETASLQRRGALPRIDLVGSAMYAKPNPRMFPPTNEYRGTWDVSVLLSWSLTDIPFTLATAAETDAKASAVRAQKARVRDGLRVEVTQAWNALQESEIALGTTRSALAASEENYRVRADMYRVGRSSSLEVTDAETDLTRARLQAVDALIDARIARVKLEHAVGRDVAGRP